MENKISHTGIVTAIEPNTVSVTMQVISACATCEEHNNCQFSESTNKEVKITTSHWKDYTIGEQVMVHVTHRQSANAIIIAYFLPALLIIAIVVILNHIHLNEMIIAAIALGSMIIYTLLLLCFRKRLQKKFTFTISK